MLGNTASMKTSRLAVNIRVLLFLLILCDVAASTGANHSESENEDRRQEQLQGSLIDV